MAAVLALAAFTVALILHIAGGAGSWWVDAELAGLALTALALIFPGFPWRRP